MLRISAFFFVFFFFGGGRGGGGAGDFGTLCFGKCTFLGARFGVYTSQCAARSAGLSTAILLP